MRIHVNESVTRDLDTLGMTSSGDYEAWFDGWDFFPSLNDLLRAQKRGDNTVSARFYGAVEEETVTDGATVGFGGSEDPLHPNWHTHTEKVARDLSHIYPGDTVSFTVRNRAKAAKVRGKVVGMEYDGNWANSRSSSWYRPTAKISIRLAPKALEGAITKLSGDNA